MIDKFIAKLLNEKLHWEHFIWKTYRTSYKDIDIELTHCILWTTLILSRKLNPRDKAKYRTVSILGFDLYEKAKKYVRDRKKLKKREFNKIINEFGKR